MNTRNAIRAAAVVASLLECICAYAASDPSSLCSNPDYKIASSRLIAVHCKEAVENIEGNAELFDATTSPTTPAATNLSVTPYQGAPHWLLVWLGQVTIQPSMKYRLVLLLHPIGESPNPAIPASAVSIDTSNAIMVSPVSAAASRAKLEFASHVAFQNAPSGPCILQIENFDRRLFERGASCDPHGVIKWPDAITPSNLARLVPDPDDIGSLFLTLNMNKDTQQIPAGVPGLQDVLGRPVKIDAKSKIGMDKAPSSKDAASYYINFNHAAGRGTKPGWALDAKVAPPVGRLYNEFRFVPNATADVGQNQVSGKKYTDTLKFGAAFARVFELNTLLQALLFSPGVTYESDKEFDRHNLLATPDIRYNFVGLYNTRQRRTLKKFAEELDIAQCRKVPTTKMQPCTPIPWSIENTRPALYGYALDFRTGLELGGALVDTTEKASGGSASQTVPAYRIARIVPQIHGLFEISRFSIDLTGAVRYLAATENTVVETSNHLLFRKPIDGWFGYSTVSGSMNLDPAGHVALTVSYKNGFSPPKFQRVNTVQSGITLKY